MGLIRPSGFATLSLTIEDVAMNHPLIKNFLFAYVLIAQIVGAVLALIGHWACYAERGIAGIFACDSIMLVLWSFLQALFWPFLLYQWLVS